MPIIPYRDGSERFYFHRDGTGAFKIPNFRSGTFPLVPSEHPGIFKANHQHLLSQPVKVISADLPRQRHAEINILNRAQEAELLLRKRVAETALVPVVIKGKNTNHLSE